MHQVIVTPRFHKEAKKITRKYPGFKTDIAKLIDSLSKNPEQGKHIGEGIYKLRIAITGKTSGKSYGARVIHAIVSVKQEVYLFSVYDKSDKKDISPHEFKGLIETVKSIKNLK